MRRAPIVLSATALGLAATLGFHPRHAQTAVPSATTAAASSPSSGSAGSGTTSSSSSAKASTATSSAKTAIGDAVATQYGDIQLKVTVSGGKITNIEAVRLPSGDPRSQEISSFAEPQLRQSALSKQDGTVDAVSGATYTSGGYQSALQSALDRAGFKTASSTGTA
jgi:uncharacterized protein with FMN-binding domain